MACFEQGSYFIVMVIVRLAALFQGCLRLCDVQDISDRGGTIVRICSFCLHSKVFQLGCGPILCGTLLDRTMREFCLMRQRKATAGSWWSCPITIFGGKMSKALKEGESSDIVGT